MNPFKRIVITLNASLDRFVQQVENHEALADASIQEIEAAASRVRTQHRRIQNDVVQLGKRTEELERSKNLWMVRARKLGSRIEDQGAALECVRRIKADEREVAQIAEQKKGQAEVVKQLSQELNKIETKLKALRLKRNALSGKQAQADAVVAVYQAQSQISIEGVLDRWEASIESQIPFEATQQIECLPEDLFEADLLCKEEHEDLKVKLNEILDGAQS